MRSKILISACLLGQPVRYNGLGLKVEDTRIDRWQAEGRLIAICPEMAAGLPAPRAPCENLGGDGAAVMAGQARVLTPAGEDLTALFLRGAHATLAQLQASGAAMAILSERSPSCGVNTVYDGTFSGRLVPGSGVTASTLRQHGVAVFSQFELDAAEAHLQRLDATPAA